jgi:mRNA interferase YafQ
MALLDEVVQMLANGETLPERYRDHKMHGDKRGYRNCHVLSDWVLLYKIDKDILTLVLAQTGTHSDILE